MLAPWFLNRLNLRTDRPCCIDVWESGSGKYSQNKMKKKILALIGKCCVCFAMQWTSKHIHPMITVSGRTVCVCMFECCVRIYIIPTHHCTDSDGSLFSPCKFSFHSSSLPSSFLLPAPLPKWSYMSDYCSRHIHRLINWVDGNIRARNG